MVDAHGAEVVKGATVTLTGAVTAVKDQSVTLDVPQPVFHEYPKVTEWGRAESAEHEAALKAADEPPPPAKKDAPAKKGDK